MMPRRQNRWDKNFNEKLIYPFFGNEKINGSFAQNWQDIFVLTLTQGKNYGTYLEIGAGPPELINNTYILSKLFNWKGVSIEWPATRLQHEWAYFRPNDVLASVDALQVNYIDLLENNFNDTTIDYLQLDIDPSINTLTALKRLPLDQYRFRVITFETDFYVGDTTARTESREILSNLGYELVIGDVLIDGNKPFEDWWVDPNLVDKDIANDIKSRSIAIQDPFKILFDL